MQKGRIKIRLKEWRLPVGSKKQSVTKQKNNSKSSALKK
jgi:hypothetical protein